MLLHELGHIDADHVVFGIEQEGGERLAQLGLAHTGRPQKEEGSIGTIGVGQPCARTANRIRDKPHGFVLAHDTIVQLVFHVQQFFALALHHLRDRDAGSPGHHLGDLFGTDLRAQKPRARRLAATALLCRMG